MIRPGTAHRSHGKRREEDPLGGRVTTDSSINKNRYTLKTYKYLMEMADAVTCSTTGRGGCHPEGVDPRRRIEVVPEPSAHGPLRAGGSSAKTRTRSRFSGRAGIAHYEDWFPARDALGHISAKYPAGPLDHLGRTVPVGQGADSLHTAYTFKSWCPYHEYKLRLAMIGPRHLALAPLSPNVFNNCRSAIKFYEASALKKPAATLAQNYRSLQGRDH